MQGILYNVCVYCDLRFTYIHTQSMTLFFFLFPLFLLRNCCALLFSLRHLHSSFMYVIEAINFTHCFVYETESLNLLDVYHSSTKYLYHQVLSELSLPMIQNYKLYVSQSCQNDRCCKRGKECFYIWDELNLSPTIRWCSSNISFNVFCFTERKWECNTYIAFLDFTTAKKKPECNHQISIRPLSSLIFFFYLNYHSSNVLLYPGNFF